MKESEPIDEPYCDACLEMLAHGDDDPRGMSHTLEAPCQFAPPIPEHSPGSPENVSRGATFTPHPTPYQVQVDVGLDGRFRQWVLLAPAPLEVPPPKLSRLP